MVMGNFYALLGLAFAVLISGVGSAIGVSRSAQASTALLSKQPDKSSKCLMLTVMPSTQGIYGFVVAFVGLLKLGVFGGSMTLVDEASGWVIFAYCLPVAIVGCASAIFQGNVVIGSINLIGKQESMGTGKVMPLIILVEMFAILSFIISFIGVMMFEIPAYVPVA